MALVTILLAMLLGFLPAPPPTAIYIGGPLLATPEAVLRDLKTGGQISRLLFSVGSAGTGNEPGAWICQIAASLGPAFDAAALVRPGLWCRHGEGCTEGDAPEAMADAFRTWKADGVRGGFVWLYDDLRACPAFTAADYARALRKGLGDEPPA